MQVSFIWSDGSCVLVAECIFQFERQIALLRIYTSQFSMEMIAFFI